MERIETGIYRREDGRLWVRTTAKDPYTAKMRQLERLMDEGATLGEARELRKALKSRVLEARTRSVSAKTVEDYCGEWLMGKCRGRQALTPATRVTYEYALCAFCDFMGAVDISTVTRVDMRNYVRWLERLRQRNGRTYSTATLRAWWRPTKQMLQDATADDYIAKDPTYRLEPPVGGEPVRETRTLSGGELGCLVAAALYTQYNNRRPEIVTLAYTGMRPGELYALRWDDVDWAGERLFIERTVSEGVIMETTKTKAPRSTHMPEIIAQNLQWQRSELERLGRLDDLVFPARSGNPRQRSSLTKPLRSATELAGIEQNVTPQVLRRTFNTLLVAQGVDRIVVRSMMGHSEEEMTERYSGVRDEQKRAAVLRLVEG